MNRKRYCLNCETREAAPHQKLCVECQREVTTYNDPGLHLQPVSKWQPQANLNRFHSTKADRSKAQ